MLVEPQGERLFRTTRRRIVALLHQAPRTVNELAKAIAISDSAVRAHLVALERDGLVRQGERRRGPSKPAFAYQLTAEAERLFPKAYARALDELLAVLRQRLPADTFDAILRETGTRIGAGTSPPGAKVWHPAALDRALAIFAQLGGSPELERRDGVYHLQSVSCPLSGLVAHHPQLCALAEALLTEVMGAPVQQECARSEPPHCAFRLPSSGS